MFDFQASLRTMVITPGDYGEKAIPVPIPNTEVKLLIADGTIGFAQWESRTSPG